MDNNENEKKIEAGKNTAHVAGKAAAGYFGGAAGRFAYDKVSDTKLGQALERNAGRKIANSPVGNVNKKLNDTGVVDAADKAMPLGQKGKTDKIPESLKRNKANQRKNTSFLKRFGGFGSSEDNDTDSNVSTEASDETAADNLAVIVRNAKKIKTILVIALPVIFVLIIFIILFSIVGYIGNLFGIVGDDNNNNNQSMTNPNSSQYQNEMRYYEKLDEVVKKYEEKCGVIIDKNYIHAVLIYAQNSYDDFFSQQFDFENLENNQESNEIDYSSLAGKVETVANLMVENCYVDYEIDGSFYNRLKNSSFFKDYYKEKLKKNDEDVILHSIFDLASIGTTIFETESNELFIRDDLKVDVVHNAYALETLTYGDFVKGSAYAYSLDSNITAAPERVKAYMVAINTKSLKNSGYNTEHSSISLKATENWYCSIDEGCHKVTDVNGTYLVTGGVDKESKDNNVLYNGKYYYKTPASSLIKSQLNTIYNEIKGNVVISDNGLTDVNLDNLNTSTGNNYTSMITNTYVGSTVTNISENNYTSGVNFLNVNVKTSAIFYDQNDYTDRKFCGRSGRTIATSGCGVTAMAIVASTLLDSNTYNPNYMMNNAYSWGYCGKGIEGTSSGFFSRQANSLKINYQRVNKNGDLNKVISALATGKSLVIANVTKGTFTNSGHYIVLGGLNSDKEQVYVYDPYNKVNKEKRNSGNGWYSFNDVIAKEARYFYIFTKG